MNRQEIREAVRTQTLVDSTHVSDTYINNLINQALREISVVADWPFLHSQSNINLVASQRNYDLPASFLRAIHLVDVDEDEFVPYVAPQKFIARIGNDTNVSNASNRLEVWTIYGNEILVSPVPSANDTARLTLYFFSIITTLNHDTSDVSPNVATPVIPEPYHWMLVDYCSWKLYEREEYYDQAAASFQSYTAYLNDMVAFYNNQVAFSPSTYGRGYGPNTGWYPHTPFPNLPWWNRF